MIHFYCTEFENSLVEDILTIGYGELYNVELKESAPYGMMNVDQHIVEFIRVLRSGMKFDKVTIHDSLPSIGEYSGTTENGRRFLQKVKF